MNSTKLAPSHACKIRQFLPSDEAGILNLLNETTLEGDRLIYHFESLSGLKQAYRNLAIWAAELDGQVVGTLAGAIKEVIVGDSQEKVGHVFHARISAGVRRLGVGNLIADANREWMLDHGAKANMCLVGAENAASLGFVTSRGYLEAGRAKFVRILRPSNTCVEPQMHQVDLNRDANLQTRVMERFDSLDLCPVELIDTLYGSSRPGYLGTLYLKSGEGLSWGSIWDKNAALKRRPVDPTNSTLFMYDIVAQESRAMEALVRGAFASHPEINRIVLVLNERSREASDVMALTDTFSLAGYTECIMTRGLNVTQEAYVDVRD